VLKSIKKERDRFYKLKVKFPENEYLGHQLLILKSKLKKQAEIGKRNYYSSKIKDNIKNPSTTRVKKTSYQIEKDTKKIPFVSWYVLVEQTRIFFRIKNSLNTK
jgi:hypothetical protein